MPVDGPAAGPPQPISLVGGLNFSTWPDLKWSRANTHFVRLQAKLGEWTASVPFSVETVLQDDCRGIDFVARLPRGIPRHEWSLDVGELLHSLRSAFDAVAWGMAHFNDAVPSSPKRVAFPICESEKQWGEAVKNWVGEIHPEFQERVRLLQPFMHATGQVTMLSMLHELDIQDKHRDLVNVSIDLDGLSVGGFFEYEDPANPGVPWVEMRTGIKFADGQILGTIYTGAPVKLTGQLIIRPAMQMQLIHNDSTLELMGTLQQFISESRRYLDILMSGLASPDQPAEPDWSPMTVQTNPR